MELVITLTGQRCDLALHPISSHSAELIRMLGRKFYTKKYLEWWRQGNTCTCGVKYDDGCAIQVRLGDDSIPFDASVIPDSAMLSPHRHFLDSKVHYLALLGYDDEFCQTTWRWQNVGSFEPGKLEFQVHRWDRILGAHDYLIVEDLRYDGRYADKESRGKSYGFNLVDPRVIDLDEVRQELGMPVPTIRGEKGMYQLA